MSRPKMRDSTGRFTPCAVGAAHPAAMLPACRKQRAHWQTASRPIARSPSRPRPRLPILRRASGRVEAPGFRFPPRVFKVVGADGGACHPSPARVSRTRGPSSRRPRRRPGAWLPDNRPGSDGAAPRHRQRREAAASRSRKPSPFGRLRIPPGRHRSDPGSDASSKRRRRRWLMARDIGRAWPPAAGDRTCCHAGSPDVASPPDTTAAGRTRADVSAGSGSSLQPGRPVSGQGTPIARHPGRRHEHGSLPGPPPANPFVAPRAYCSACGQ